MANAGTLVHHVARFHQGFLVFVHEACPAPGHDHDLEICFMSVPARACFWCHIGPDQVRDDLAMGGLGNAKVTVQEKITQTARCKRGVGWFHVRKLGDGEIRHDVLLLNNQMLLCSIKQELFQPESEFRP